MKATCVLTFSTTLTTSPLSYIQATVVSHNSFALDEA